MYKKVLYPIIVVWGFISFGQSNCPVMNFPLSGATNVSVNTTISWNAVDGALGYYLLAGTTPDGRDIIDRIDVGNDTTYTHPTALPGNTEIYLRVTVYFGNNLEMSCPTHSFETGDEITSPPSCTSLISPQNYDSEVETTTELEWNSVPGASGYRLIFYQDATATHIIDTMTYSENRTGEINLPANTTIYITIMPFNEVGNALGCTVASFTTTSNCAHTINSVDDFYQCDLNGDSFEEFHIDLDVLETRLIGNQGNLTVTYHNPGGDLIDFTIGTQYSVNQRSILARATDANGCFKETLFNLIVLPAPKVSAPSDVFECSSYILPELARGNGYFTETSGRGKMFSPGETITDSQRIYIYAEVGDCHDQSSFQVNIDPKLCQENYVEILPIVFPKFFTPNNDGVNDTWQANREVAISSGVVQIFDRYGRLVRQFDTASNVDWDGTSQGSPMPEADYWYKFFDTTADKIVTGHFTLKR